MFQAPPRWILQAGLGVALVVSLNFVVSTTVSSQPAAGVSSTKPGTCEPGFSGSPETGCTDVNECAVSNGGCHRLTACENTPGSRNCGKCPKDYVGDGYIGCFDVNECATADCAERMPQVPADAPAPAVTTSGDVTVAATSAAGAQPTFTVSAKDSVDGTRPAYCTPASGSAFKVGKTTVTCWAFNKRGKIGRSTFTVTVTN